MAEALVLVILGKIGSVLIDEAVKSLGTRLKKEAAVLQEAEEKLKHIEIELSVMRAFLSEVEIGEQDPKSEAWLKELRKVAHDVEDIIDEYAHLAGEHYNRSCLKRIFHKTKISISLRAIAARLKEIDVRLQKLSAMKPRYNISFRGGSTSTIIERQEADAYSSYLEEAPIGIGEHKEKLVAWLTDGNSDHSIVTVWGMGGLGKTTLVKNVFDSQVIQNHFGCHIWLIVSQKYEGSDLLKSIIKGVNSSLDTEKMDLSDLLQTVRECMKEKKYLLVLDDVWSKRDWINLARAFVGRCDGSKIVITTRTEEVAALGGEYVLKLDFLCENDALELFYRRAFKNEEKRCPEALEDWARKIVAKCQGLPLALVAIGSLLSDRPKDAIEWERFYEQFNWELSNHENANELNWVNKVINLSYYYLPSDLKNCFLYCSIFPEDYLIKTKRLMRLWVSEGFICVQDRGRLTLEELAEGYLNKLIQRSMLQVVRRNVFGRVKTCRMHDIVRESAITISRKQDLHMVIDDLVSGNNIPQARLLSIHVCKDGILSGVKLPSLRTLISCVARMIRFIDLDCPSNSSKYLNDIFVAVSSFKYLRVLDLQCFPISHLPDSVTRLFNLHHLDLRNAWISELPKTIGRLRNLEVLDLKGTFLEKLPREVTKLKKLRYLDLQTGEGLEFSEDLCALKDLQTLKFNARRQKSIGWIGNLTQLRCLHIYHMKADHCAELWDSIAKLCFLSNLTIRLDDTRNNRFTFGDMDDVALQHLQKLYLEGGISDTVVPSLFRFFGNNLRKLILLISKLDEDPLPSLSHLSNLTSLKLDYAYEGHQLCFKAGWFPHLKILDLDHLVNLNLLEIENGALHSLEELHLCYLVDLLVVPDGIKYLTALKEINLAYMKDEFMERIKGEDRSKVAHVPTIKLFTWNDCKWHSLFV